MIHEQAIVDPETDIADDVEIGPFCVIGPGVEIGQGTRIGSHVVVRGPTRIGRENRIFSFAAIGEAPQDMKYADEPTRLELGDRNTIREYATMNRGTVGGGGVTRIGSDNLFMAYTHVAHDCIVGDRAIFSNAASLAGHVEVGDWAILGGFTSVHQFTRIGEHSFAGLGTIINRDVPPFVTVAGNHARAYGINKNGLKRRDFTAEAIRALHRAYMVLIKSRKTTPEQRADVDELAEQFPEVRRFVDFIDGSERGVTR
ncbi:MAG: acyl-ACP--UDP-N-acetylglucosamine O-acyltransferase [Halofilum sp. (in: g-proteobacteria)]|nr:acyl-ACP--UDP-N-acetylglucosamine O-acyltransferase [Halofilum sp. (in: g-proteobacteria)]